MLSAKQCLRPLRVFSVALAALVLGASPAQAQFDMGMGMGFFGGFSQVPSPTGLLNQQALIAAGRPREGVPSRTPYANNPNAFINNLRDNGFVAHSEIQRNLRQAERRAAAAAAAAPTNTPEVQTQRATALAGNPVLPLASFFNAAQTLVWPSGAPTSGDLKEKRDASDQASVAVLEETKRQNAASLSSAAYARKKLLGYGQPALQEIRANSTPAIADAFHMFLLSLYDSLEQAASPPPAPPAPPAPPLKP